MKALSWIGAIAMFLVGGTFVAEGIQPLEHAIEAVVAASGGWGAVVKVGLFGVVGAVAGFITAITVSGVSWARKLRAQ
ncbi:Inner membrane protein YedI [compost metagenome]